MTLISQTNTEENLLMFWRESKPVRMNLHATIAAFFAVGFWRDFFNPKYSAADHAVIFVCAAAASSWAIGRFAARFQWRKA